MNIRLIDCCLLTVLALTCTGCGEGAASGEYVDYRDTQQNSATDVAQPGTEIPPADDATDARTAADAGPAVGDASETVARTDATESAAASEATSTQNADAVAATSAASNSGETSNNATVAETADTVSPETVDSGGQRSVSDSGGAAENSGLPDDLTALMAERAALLGGDPLADPAVPAEPRKIKLLIPDKRFRTERGTNAVRVSYDDIDLLQALNMEPVPIDAVDYFPDWLLGLDGRKIRIRGFMFPTFQATGITQFTLARDNGICCFVRKPKIYDIISIEMADGETTDYIEGRPFDVEGDFRIDPEADETELFRLYRIENAKVLR